jgi:hypothetical protein
MHNRLGVNYDVSQAIAKLAREGLIDDPGTIRPLVGCLDHPLLSVADNCHEALIHLTRHMYGGWNIYNGQSSTQEGRQRLVADWTNWEQKLHNGHPIFDGWLKSEVLETVHQLGERLEAVLKDAPRATEPDFSAGVAAGYIDYQVAKASFLSCGNYGYETIFEFDVGDHSADNWPPATGNRPTAVESVGIKIFRPGIEAPVSRPPRVADGNGALLSDRIFKAPEGIYRETFPALDLEVQVSINTRDARLRSAYYAAAKEALAELRADNSKLALRE